MVRTTVMPLTKAGEPLVRLDEERVKTASELVEAAFSGGSTLEVTQTLGLGDNGKTCSHASPK